MMAPRSDVRRYTTVPFPRYRFIPGKFPHPTSHPDGHSYVPPGADHPHVTYKSPEQWHDSVDYLFGCDLYNHFYWWEAHETWEGLWQLTDKSGVQGHFLQALIQVAARHLKLEMNKLDGVQSIGVTSTGHMQFVINRVTSPTYMGLPFREWFANVQSYFASHAQAHDAHSFPYIFLGVGQANDT